MPNSAVKSQKSQRLFIQFFQNMDMLNYFFINNHLLCFQFAYGVPDLTLKEIACSQALLQRFLIFPRHGGLYGVHNAMCALSQQRLQTIEDVLYANIDFFKLLRLVSHKAFILYMLLCTVTLMFRGLRSYSVPKYDQELYNAWKSSFQNNMDCKFCVQ